MDGKNQVQKAIRTFGDVFVPVIPALVATGLFLGLTFSSVCRRGPMTNRERISITNSTRKGVIIKSKTAGTVFRSFFSSLLPITPATKAGRIDNFLALFGMTNADIPQTFQVLVDVLSGTTFAFLPAIVCWSTFRVFGGSPVLGLILGLMLVNGALPNAYSVADPSSGVTPLPHMHKMALKGLKPVLANRLISNMLNMWWTPVRVIIDQKKPTTRPA